MPGGVYLDFGLLCLTAFTTAHRDSAGLKGICEKTIYLE